MINDSSSVNDEFKTKDNSSKAGSGRKRSIETADSNQSPSAGASIKSGKSSTSSRRASSESGSGSGKGDAKLNGAAKVPGQNNGKTLDDSNQAASPPQPPNNLSSISISNEEASSASTDKAKVFSSGKEDNSSRGGKNLVKKSSVEADGEWEKPKSGTGNDATFTKSEASKIKSHSKDLMPGERSGGQDEARMKTKSSLIRRDDSWQSLVSLTKIGKVTPMPSIQASGK